MSKNSTPAALILAFTLLISFFGTNTQAEIKRLLQVDEGVFRGSQPMTEEDYQALEKMKIKTIINLRWDESVTESKVMADKYNFKFFNFPIVAKETPKTETLKSIFSILLDAKNQPVFLHCQHGKDRTGLIFALYRVKVQGWDPERAYEEWVKMGFAEKVLKELKSYFRKETANKSIEFDESSGFFENLFSPERTCDRVFTK